MTSEWVGEEAEEARERGLLIPALIEAVEPPLGFRRIQAADLVGWEGDAGHPGLQRLLVDIRSLLGATPASGTSTVAATGEDTAKASRRRPMLFGLGAAVVVLIAVAAGLVWRFSGGPAAPAMPAASAGAWIDGHWQGSVAYGWGPTVREAFDFRVIDGTLTGSAGFLGRSRAIEDGVVGADRRSLHRPLDGDGRQRRAGGGQPVCGRARRQRSVHGVVDHGRCHAS